MTVLDAIHAAGGFTNFVTGRIEIFHTDGTKGSYKYQGAVDDTNKPPLLKKKTLYLCLNAYFDSL